MPVAFHRSETHTIDPLTLYAILRLRFDVETGGFRPRILDWDEPVTLSVTASVHGHLRLRLTRPR